jgi:hypothetical protein
VEQGVVIGKLNSDRAENLAIGILDDLKFSEASLEFARRKAHGIPEGFERFQIIYGRTADAEHLRTHGRWLGCICFFEIMWQFQREIKLKTDLEQHDK